eukprot:440550_1
MEKKIDLSVFKKEDCANESICKNNTYQDCIAMNRLFASLIYYSMLDIINNRKHKNIFNHFMNEVYHQFVNDAIHLNTQHSHELEQINEELTECNMSSCQYTSRHHDQQQAIIMDNSDSTLNFYKQQMDSLHFYLYHCFDVGIRTKTEKSDQSPIYEEEKKDDMYFDAAFSRIHKIISQRKDTTKTFERFSTKTSNKFNIKTDEQIDNQADDDQHEDNDTYLDALYKHLKNINIPQIYIDKLYKFIQCEQYDTESIKLDITSNTRNTNIANCVQNDKYIQQIKQFIKGTKISDTSFSIGLRLYYWDYYKHLNQLGLDEQEKNNYNDHSGFDVCDLFISPKYGSFKEEISNYKHFTMEQYKQDVITKVNKYIKTNLFKSTKPAHSSVAAYIIHYGIKEGDPLSTSHLLGLVFYTDYSELSSHFSATFRKKTAFETIESMKKRNSKYYYLSKYLRECVECYGQSAEGEYSEDSGGYIKQLSGPFYSGISVLLSIPAFNIRLCSPTSTSKQITVAIKFSRNKGIIIQFNNIINGGVYTQYSHLRGFDVSSISRYPEEDERLFCGGFYFMKIESVILISTQRNFRKIIHSLFYLDTMICGGIQRDIKISRNDIKVIKTVFSKILNKATMFSFDNYIFETFASFVQNKTQIILDLDRLSYASDDVRCLFLYDWMKTDLYEPYIWPEVKRKLNDFTNLFRKEMLLIFKNTKTVIIKTSSTERRAVSYSLSMIALLSLMKRSKSLEKVIVKCTTYDNYEEESDTESNTESNTDSDTDKQKLDQRKPDKYKKNNWIHSLWCDDEKLITKCYEMRNYNISMKTVYNHHEECWFEINMKN